MRALSHLRFDSLLDVGSAEGYNAHIAGELFDVKVKCCDLSEEACKRVEEIFHIETIPADVHDLPFDNDQFDVVLCSETLEHVTDLSKAVDEVMRVARKAVVITVPHEPGEATDKNIEEGIPHGHIHRFDLESFGFLRSAGCQILSRKMFTPLLEIPFVLAEAIPREYRKDMKYPKIFVDIGSACVPILRRLFGKRTVAFLMRLDGFVCKFTSRYDGILFIILKDTSASTDEQILNVSAHQIIEFAVPYHYLNKNV